MLEFSSFCRRFPNVIFNYLQFLSFDHLNKPSQFCACGSPLFKILWLTGRFGDSWFCSGSKSKAPQLHWNDWHQWNGFGWFWNRVMCGNKRAGEALECGRSLGSWNLLILFASLILCVAITQVAEPQRTNPTPDIHTSMRGCYGELRSTEPTCEPEVISDSWTSVGLQ